LYILCCFEFDFQNLSLSIIRVLLQNFDQTVPYISSFLSFREIDSLEFLVRKQLREKPDLTPRVILVDGNGILHVRRAGIACFLGTRTGLPTIGIGKTLYCEEGLNKELVKAQIDDTLNFLVSEEGTLGLKKKDIEFVVFTLGLSSKTKNDTQKRREDALDELCTTKCRGVGVKLKVTGGETLACALIGHGGKIGGPSKQNKRGTKNPIFISIGHGVSLEDAVKMSVRISKARIPEPVRQADLWGRELIRERNVK